MTGTEKTVTIDEILNEAKSYDIFIYITSVGLILFGVLVKSTFQANFVLAGIMALILIFACAFKDAQIKKRYRGK